MQRNPKQLENRAVDLLVVGGGINGAWIALDASLRGLSTALVDKGDFGAATSAATGRMIHGGIRYLQHLALGRLKASLHERMLLLRNAPHLVHPLPMLIPTSGHLLKGKEILTLAMLVYDAFACRALPGPPYADLPAHERLSREETLRLEPLLSGQGLTGAVRFFDCQMPFPERLTLAVVQSAHQAGAVVANHVQAVALIRGKRMVEGVQCRDMLSGEELSIRAKFVVNAAGPWADGLLDRENPCSPNAPSRFRFSKGIHIITRSLTNTHGLALATRHQHSGSLLDRGGRHFFIVPWQGGSLVGTTNTPFHGSPDDPMVTEEDIQGLIRDVNSVYPSANLQREDVRFFYGGLYPDNPHRAGKGYQGSREDRIVDHGGGHGLRGLISVTGVKYTTARRLASQVVDMVVHGLERPALPCATETAVLYGGDMPGLAAFLGQQQTAHKANASPGLVSQLVHLYGVHAPEVLQAGTEVDARTPGQGPSLVMAQTRFAVRREMACRLNDVLFRRTPVGLFGHPGRQALVDVASVMAEELEWDQARIDLEIAAAEDCYRTA